MAATDKIIILIVGFVIISIMIGSFVYIYLQVRKLDVKQEEKKKDEVVPANPLKDFKVNYSRSFNINIKLIKLISNSYIECATKVIRIPEGEYTRTTMPNIKNPIYIIDEFYRSKNSKFYPYETAFQILFNTNETAYTALVIKRLVPISLYNYFIVISVFYDNTSRNITSLFLQNLGITNFQYNVLSIRMSNNDTFKLV